MTLRCDTDKSEEPMTHGSSVTPHKQLRGSPLLRTVYSQPEPSASSLYYLSLEKHIQDPQMMFLNSS